MSIGTVVGFGATSGSAITNAPACTLPSMAGSGLALLLLGFNGANAATASTPTGWTYVADKTNGTLNNGRAYLFKRAVSSSDSGLAVNSTLSASSRWFAGGAYLPGATDIDVSAAFNDTALTASPNFPAVTPTVDDDVIVQACFSRFPAQVVGMTPAGSGATELVDLNTSNASGASFGGWIGVKALAGGAGTATSIPKPSFATSAYATGFTIAVKGATQAPTVHEWLLATAAGWVAADALTL